mmetsp:Transcript_17190/g.28764  ORF Transcript_17190/g.28764 Transcript_17190/m.28764 type:complete len:249 (+) Transcript_17190:273-1019(+)
MSLFLLCCLLLLRQDGNITTAPVHNQGLTNQKQHNGDLSNGEEAPNRSLLHQIIGNKGSQHRSKSKQENTLNDHTFLLIKSKERGKHKEGVDTRTLYEVGRIRHGHRPAQMVHCLCLKGAKSITTEPFSRRIGLGDIHHIQHRNVSQKMTNEKKETTNDAKSLDDKVAVAVLLRLGKTAVDDMTEIRLHADVKESSQSQNTVDPGITSWVIQSSRNKHILNSLQKLHREEEEDPGSQLHIVGLGVDPP